MDYLNRANDDRLKYINIFKNLGIRQLITKFTRPNKKGGTCIDWVVTNSIYVNASGTYDVFISDHLPVYCIRKKARESHKIVYTTFRDMSNYDADVFSTLLKSESWEEFFAMEQPDDMWSILYNKIYDILAIMCPFKRYRQREKVTPWITPEIYRIMRRRDHYIRLFRATGFTCYLEWARRCRNIVNSMIDRAKANYIKTQLRANGRNPKKFWRIINNIIAPTDDVLVNQRFFDQRTNNLVPVGEEAEFLNNYFVDIVKNLDIPLSDNPCDNVYNIQENFCFSDNLPTVLEVTKLIEEIDVTKSSCVKDTGTKFCKTTMLSIPNVVCHLFCSTLTTGIIPRAWVEGIITLIPKDGDLTRPGNWRPITQTSVFAKLLEKLGHKRLLNYFLDNNIISKYQFVFLPGRSTQLAVFELVKQIYSAINNKKVFGSICLDISKAFDCIDHVRLFKKMRSCGLSELVLRWFRAYFDRTQVVKLNNTMSKPLSVTTGIGQGTILGPLIFIFYINDVISNVGDLRVNMFADDCLIYAIGNDWDRMVPKIQNGLDNFQNWCLDNRLKLNVKKSKSLVIGTTFKLMDINLQNTFRLNDHGLENVNLFNYLGIILDKNMTLVPLFAKVKKVVSNKIYNLVKIRNYIDTNCALLIYKQTILPLLDYAGFMLISGNVSDRNDLQTLQNDSLRICFNVRLRDRIAIDVMHRQAKLLSLEQRRRKQLLSLMFIYKNRHEDIRRVHARNTRGADVYSFIRERYNNVKYKNSPYYKGSLLWDSLSVEARRSVSSLDFKKSIIQLYRHYDPVLI